MAGKQSSFKRYFQNNHCCPAIQLWVFYYADTAIDLMHKQLWISKKKKIKKMWSTLAKTWHLVKWHDCCILPAGCWWHKMQRVCTRGLVWPLLCLIDLLRQWQWANYTWNIPRVTSNNSWRQLWLASFTQPICVSFKPYTQVARWRWKRKRGWPFNQSLSQCHAIERETFQAIRSLFHPFTVIPPLCLSLSLLAKGQQYMTPDFCLTGIEQILAESPCNSKVGSQH